MRVAHVTATFPPYQGGTGNVALHNARCLAELGHDVTVYTAGTAGAPRDESNGFRIRRFDAALRIGNAPLLPGLLRLKGHDIIHLHYPFIFGAEIVFAVSKLKRQPYVLTYHNDLVSPGIKGLSFLAYERFWAGRLLGSARRVIVTSVDGAAASRIVGPVLTGAPDRVREVPNGVDVDRFRPGVDPTPVRTRFGIDAARHRVILFVGSMDSAHHPKTGVPILLEAAARLGDEDAVVLLVGGGDRVREYASLAEELGIGDRVRFAGRVPNEELPELYAAADVVVQPSLLFEPFGLVAVEAMACAKPVVVSDLPGVRRVVADAGGGFTCRPGDAEDVAHKIRTLLADRDLRRRLGSAGRSAVERRYDWRRIAPTLLSTYQEALDSP